MPPAATIAAAAPSPAGGQPLPTPTLRVVEVVPSPAGGQPPRTVTVAPSPAGGQPAPTASPAPATPTPRPAAPTATPAPAQGAPAPTPQPIVVPGDRVRVATASGKAAPVALDDAAWDELWKAVDASDDVGLNDLIRRGRVAMVPSGTGALVIDRGFTSVKIRVQEGAHAGKAGWILREQVAPA